MSLTGAEREMVRLSEQIDERLSWVKDQVREYAQAENAYRKSKAQAWVRAPREDNEGRRVTAAEREAWVDAADGLRQAGFEAVRAARGQLSAWQTLVGLDRAEAEFSRTGPR